MRQQTNLILAITSLTLFPPAVWAERTHEKSDDATHVVTGTAQRIYTRETKTQIQYIVEIKVNQVERPATLKPGELLSAYCFQTRKMKPIESGTVLEKAKALLASIGESGHSAVPKEGEQIRALTKPRHGRLEGLYPDWFSPVKRNIDEAAEDNAPIQKGKL